jgi:hypothetical protein
MSVRGLCKDVLFEDVGFDYVSLTGGRYQLLQNSNNATEPPFFRTFATIVSVIDALLSTALFPAKETFTKTRIYMNGGFVTAEDMHNAVVQRWTDGICIARAAAAEPGFQLRHLLDLLECYAS